MVRTRRSELEDINLLELAPRRVTEWSEVDGRVVLRLQPPAQRWRSPLKWLSYRLSAKTVRLDDIGSLAWRLFDGRRSVAEVAEELRATFGERVEPAEERLGMLVRMMHRGGRIDYSDFGDAGSGVDLRAGDGR
jgi:hypothetical protein